MDKQMQEAKADYLDNLSEEQRREFNAMSEERKRKCITENILIQQDKAMWEKNEGISQLEHRINTDSFQG